MHRIPPYSLKYLVKCLLGLALFITAMKFTSGYGFAAMFLLLFACLAKRKAELLLYTLMATIAITMGNSNIVIKGGGFGLMQRVMMLSLSVLMLGMITGTKSVPALSPLLGMYFYLGYMALVSGTGWCPLISYMKLLLFSLVYMAYFGVAKVVINSARADMRKTRSVFLMLAFFFVLGSVALIPFPSLGQMSYEQVQAAINAGSDISSLFKGMTLHSQALGPVAAAIGVLMYADMLFSVRYANKLYLLIMACVPIVIWRTASRTAMGSLILGLAFVTFHFMKTRGVKSSWKSRVMNVILLMVALGGLAVLAIPAIRDRAAGFALKFNKSDKREVTFDEITATRRGRWEESLYHFNKSPIVGNGFQVSVEMQDMNASLATLSAPVEKGVWITAILEEGGLCGFVIFIVFVLTAYFSLLKRKCYEGLSAFFVLLVANLGEFTLFSLTSTGGVLWSLVFMGVIFDAQRQREVQRALFAANFRE